MRRTVVNSGYRLIRSKALTSIVPQYLKDLYFFVSNSCNYNICQFLFFSESNEWTGTWGKHMKSINFKVLKDYQKINHFPGTFQIGRKDRLWRNLFKLMTKFGKKEWVLSIIGRKLRRYETHLRCFLFLRFGFIPKTYVLPQDGKMLRAAWERSNGREAWIIKPVCVHCRVHMT